jgi:hypothetical protein
MISTFAKADALVFFFQQAEDVIGAEVGDQDRLDILGIDVGSLSGPPSCRRSQKPIRD